MIIAHVIQFFCKPNRFALLISSYINLTSFSGFLFVFGYVNYIAYFDKEDYKLSQKKLLKTAINILVIYYLSAFLFRLLVSNSLINNGLYGILKILLLWDLPGYSEFLLSFFIITLLSFVFINYFKKIQVKHGLYLILICLLSTFIPATWVTINQVGLIIGSCKISAFPIVPYFPYFLLGILFAKLKFKFNVLHLCVAALCSLSLIIFIFIFKKVPSRFPPNIFWILGPAFYLYLYFAGSKLIYKMWIGNYISFVEKIGNSTLFYLILSNIFIFSISTRILKDLSLTYCFLLSSIILFFIYRMQKIIK